MGKGREGKGKGKQRGNITMDTKNYLTLISTAQFI